MMIPAYTYIFPPLLSRIRLVLKKKEKFNDFLLSSQRDSIMKTARGSKEATTPSKSLAKNVEMHTTQTSLVSGLSRL